VCSACCPGWEGCAASTTGEAIGLTSLVSTVALIALFGTGLVATAGRHVSATYLRIGGIALVLVVLVTLVAITAGFGAPRATAVIAVLGYRVVNYWLPLLPGALAYLRLRLSPNAAGQARSSTPPTG
jgi:uncharacterized membrane protein YbhN (UPF0104 family)